MTMCICSMFKEHMSFTWCEAHTTATSFQSMEEGGTPEELLHLQEVILGGGIEAVMDQVQPCFMPDYYLTFL